MASDNGSNDNIQEASANPGIKPDVNSLFVGHDEETGESNTRGQKRLKINHDPQVEVVDRLTLNDDGNVVPYNAFAAEGRPRLAVYHPGFKKAEKLAGSVCKQFLQVVEELKKAGYSNDEINRICESKLKRYLFVQERYPCVDPVACLGPAGVGKSSSMNCLLDQSGAAPESDSAHRGTNLVHEFSTACMEQTARYQVAAPYYREAQVEALVRKHCRNIFTFLSQAHDEFDEDEVDELQKKYDTAIEFFRILLCDQSEFVSEEEAQGYFDARQSDPEDKVVRDLKKQVEQFKKTRPLVDMIEYHHAESIKELADIFRKVSRVPKATGIQPARPHPWPVINKVQIRQLNDLLDAGVILGDTPGVTDSNQSVVDATSNYIRKAGTVLVFESFKRIAASETLDANLRECIRLGKMRSTHLIVTMIDNGQSIRTEDREELSSGDLEKLEEAEAAVSRLKAEERTLKAAKPAALNQAMASPVAFEEYRKLESCIEALPAKIALAEAKIGQVTIEIRTREVANELKDRLRKLERSKHAPDLPVHFVSNTQYQKHLSGYDPKKPPTLDVEGTGIPALRRMLYAIPSRGKSTTLSRICGTLLPRIFGSITGVLTKSRMERKQDVEIVIIGIMGRYEALVQDLMVELQVVFARRVVKVVDDNKHIWEERVEKLLKVWEKYRAVTFTAFCRRSGHWRAKKGEADISWNEKIQNIMVDRLADGFDAFDEDLLGVETNAAANVDELFKKLEMALEECQDFQGVEGTKGFLDMVHKTRDSTLKDLTKLFSTLRNRVEYIRHAAVLDTEDSYIAIALQPTYEQCLTVSNPNAINGGGTRKVHKRSGAHLLRVEKLRAKLIGTGEEPGIFNSVADTISTVFDAEMTAWEDQKCKRLLAGAYSAILKDFNTRFVVSEEVKSEENKEAVARLKNAVAEAMAVIEGPMKEHLEEFEAYEKAGGA